MIHIQSAKVEDAEAVRDLLGEINCLFTSRTVVESIKALNASGCDAMYLAFDGERPLGLLTLYWTLTFWRKQPIARITTLVIHSAARRRKIGCTLVEHAMAVAKNAGCNEIEVMAKAGAHAFYEALGFSRTVDKYRRLI